MLRKGRALGPAAGIGCHVGVLLIKGDRTFGAHGDLAGLLHRRGKPEACHGDVSEAPGVVRGLPRGCRGCAGSQHFRVGASGGNQERRDSCLGNRAHRSAGHRRHERDEPDREEIKAKIEKRLKDWQIIPNPRVSV